MSFKGFSVFNSGCHFVQWSGTILKTLVMGHPRYISVKLFGNRATGLGEEINLKLLFYF